MQGIKYAVDLVFCIDKTSSMTPVIDLVKNNALKFHEDALRTLKEKDKFIDTVRIKIVAFGDIAADNESVGWLKESEFFTIPEQTEEYSSYVNAIEAEGGGPIPENGLEALTLALNSNWTNEGDRRRHVVVLYTDAPAHPFEDTQSKGLSHYPEGMPKSLDDITDKWQNEQDANKNAKRLVFFAPDAYPWTEIGNEWDYTIHVSSQAGKGLEEHDYQTILDVIANSL